MGVAELVCSLRIVKCQLLIMVPLISKTCVSHGSTQSYAIRCHKVAGRWPLQDFWLKRAAQELVIFPLVAFFHHFIVIFPFLILQPGRHSP